MTEPSLGERDRRPVWLFVQSVEPTKRWGVRVGNRWLEAHSVDVRCPMETRTQRAQPRMYLWGNAVVEWKGDHVTIR